MTPRPAPRPMRWPQDFPNKHDWLPTMTPRPAPRLVRAYLRLVGYDGITLPPFGVYIRAECLALWICLFF